MKYLATILPMAVQSIISLGMVAVKLNSWTWPAPVGAVTQCKVKSFSFVQCVLYSFEAISNSHCSKTTLAELILFLPKVLSMRPFTLMVSPLRTKFLSQLKATVVVPQLMQQPQHLDSSLLVKEIQLIGMRGGSRMFRNMLNSWVQRSEVGCTNCAFSMYFRWQNRFIQKEPVIMAGSRNLNGNEYWPFWTVPWKSTIRIWPRQFSQELVQTTVVLWCCSVQVICSSPSSLMHRLLYCLSVLTSRQISPSTYSPAMQYCLLTFMYRVTFESLPVKAPINKSL